jgi:hypothetical protein
MWVGLGEIVYEMFALIELTAIIYIVGAWPFTVFTTEILLEHWQYYSLSEGKYGQ